MQSIETENTEILWFNWLMSNFLLYFCWKFSRKWEYECCMHHHVKKLFSICGLFSTSVGPNDDFDILTLRFGNSFLRQTVYEDKFACLSHNSGYLLCFSRGEYEQFRMFCEIYTWDKVYIVLKNIVTHVGSQSVHEVKKEFLSDS